jgi:hypothetical protein
MHYNYLILAAHIVASSVQISAMNTIDSVERVSPETVTAQDLLPITGVTSFTPKMRNIHTEFTSKNLGKIMSVFGFLRNKEEDCREPFFVDFEGGEWVLAATQQDKRLRAAIFATILQSDTKKCRIITQQRKNTKKSRTEFAYAELPLIDLYLIGKYFTINKETDTQTLSYYGPIEFDLYFNFKLWFEYGLQNNPEITKGLQHYCPVEPSVVFEEANKPKHAHKKFRTARERALALSSYSAHTSTNKSLLSETFTPTPPQTITEKPY